MTPREELGRRLGRELAKNRRNLPLQAERSQAVLDGYAIGKWVPVSERLPERDARGNWTGIVKCRDGEVAPVIFNQKNTPVAVFTHWLELDIPEVETD